MDDGKKRTSWATSWKDWFDSSDSSEAKGILQTTMAQLPEEEMSEYVIQEFQTMKRTKGTTKGTDVQKSLESMTLEELRTHVQSNLPRLDGEIGQWKANREHGARKAGRKVAEFTEEFDAFLAGFSGVVEVVKMVDNQYGGTASAVLFVLFATIKAKAGNDRAILSSMKLLAHRLPDLEIYYQVYADVTLAKMLSTAYVDVLTFAQKATKYFQGRGIGRVIKGLAQPSAFADLEQVMVQDFQAIRTRCDALVSERIFRLHEQNENLLAQVRQLEETINSIHDGDASRRFRKSLLRRGNSEPVPKSTRDHQLAEHADLLSSIFQSHKGRFSIMTVDKLQSTPEYQDWADAQSSLLILDGYNSRRCPANHSWLALAAAEYTLQLMNQGVGPANNDNFKGPVVAHVLGVRETREIRQEDEPLDADGTLAAIAEQIVEQQPRILRRGSAIDNITFKADDHTLKGREQMLLSIVDRCPPRPVFILIDRMDKCCGQETWRVLMLLLRLVQQTKARLKIMLVFRSDVWNINERRASIEEEWLASKNLVLLRRNQDQLW